MIMKRVFKCLLIASVLAAAGVAWYGPASGRDLEEIRSSGVLRHLGVPYANFVTGSGDGMDVELIQLFAAHLGVRYDYVKTSWGDVIGDLTGKKVNPSGDGIQVIGDVPVKGDLIANGFTMLDWRKKIVDYSIPVFPTQVWLLARADSRINPIVPGDGIQQDIAQVRSRLDGLTVFGIANTCLDPDLYDLETAGAWPRLFQGTLNQLAPAVMNGEADTTLLDVPDALIALDKWPGEVKVIGPVSEAQEMGVAFAKTSTDLRAEFNRFLARCWAEGVYVGLVKKYYPAVFDYYPDFFDR